MDRIAQFSQPRQPHQVVDGTRRVWAARPQTG